MKIISLAPSITETLFFLGLSEEVAGVTEQCNYPEEAKEKEKIGSFVRPDIEKIASLKPDLAVIAGKIHQRFHGEFEKYNIPLFTFAPKSVAGTLEGMEELGKACGQGESSRMRVNVLRERITRARRNIPGGAFRPRVFRLMDRAEMFTPGPGSYQYDAICFSGGRAMPVSTQETHTKVTLEDVIEFDPEVIISCGRKRDEKPKPQCKGCRREHPMCRQVVEEIYHWKGWEKISAIKERQVYAFPCRIICRSAPNVVDLVERMTRMFQSPLNVGER